jgi:hypothetical protein
VVKAAKASGGPHKKAKSKVITNADVKKSATKSSGGANTAAPPLAAIPVDPAAAKKKAHAEQLKRIADAEVKVNTLEKELTKIEQSYYESSDPDRRDKEIAKQFMETKEKLAQARKELEAAKQ